MHPKTEDDETLVFKSLQVGVFQVIDKDKYSLYYGSGSGILNWLEDNFTRMNKEFEKGRAYLKGGIIVGVGEFLLPYSKEVIHDHTTFNYEERIAIKKGDLEKRKDLEEKLNEFGFKQIKMENGREKVSRI